MEAATIVQRVRALSGITRKELAELAGLSPSTIGRIERGTLDPTWGTICRILATGYRINGDTVVSAGDQTAITAARHVLERRLATDPMANAETSTSAPRASAQTSARDTGRLATDAAATDPREVLAPGDEMQEATSLAFDQWLQRWTRVGWLSDRMDAEAMVKLAVTAGNAGKIARRRAARRHVAAVDGWRALARRLDEEGIDYAVSGLVAARADRVIATAANPVIYVDDPSLVVTRLGLEETTPGRGVLLLAPGDAGLSHIENDGGVRFVSCAQGLLDAFAGSGREPDKAEDALRSLLSVCA